MKKLLLVISFIAIMLLGACTSAPDDVALENRVKELELQLAELQLDQEALELRFDNLVMSEGLNGQRDYYENSPDSAIYMSRLGYEMMVTEKDYLDKSKFPSYIFNAEGEYVSVNELGNLLTLKYLGIESVTVTGYQFKIQLYDEIDLSNEEYIVRLSMMIIELSQYDFYTIDSPELMIINLFTTTHYMHVRMSLLVTDKYNLHPAIFWNELLDTRIENYTFDIELMDAIYDQYILDGTFDGYVLNYE